MGTQATNTFVAVTRVIALSLVLLMINISEGVVHRRVLINVLAAAASALSLIVGFVGAIDVILRRVLRGAGFVGLEALFAFELIGVSALCTTIAVLTGEQPSSKDKESSNGELAREVEVISVAMALTTALLIRVDLTLTVRVAAEIYMEKLLAVASAENNNGNKSTTTSPGASMRDGDGLDESVRRRRDVDRMRISGVGRTSGLLREGDAEAIEPPHISVWMIAATHLLAAIALPAPLVAAFVVSAHDGVVIGHLCGVLILAWIRVIHSFFIAYGQLKAIQHSADEDEQEIRDLSEALVAVAASTQGTGGAGASPGGNSNGPATEPFASPDVSGTQTSGLYRTNSNLAPSFALHTMATTQSYRNRALVNRAKAAVSASVREQKPKYRLGMRLGKGAHGDVKAAMNVSTGELMAAKRIRFLAEGEETDEHMAMLENEVNTLRALDHPHIVKYLFCDQPEPPADADDNFVDFLIFMEYVAGGSLDELVKNFGRLEEEAAASFVVQVLLGLEYLHSTGRIHRDMKPANVLVRTDGHVKITDFGTALDLSGKRDEEEVHGFRISEIVLTPFYAPPEALRTQRARRHGDASGDGDGATAAEAMMYGVAGDIWALGCTVMQLLTGQYPWTHLDKNAHTALYRKLLKEADDIEQAIDDGEWESGGERSENCGAEAPPKTCPTLPTEGISEKARSFLEACLQIDPKARLNASALLCHPWIQQFDLIDTHQSPLHDWVPMAANAGVLTHPKANRLGSSSTAAASQLTPEQARLLRAAYSAGVGPGTGAAAVSLLMRHGANGAVATARAAENVTPESREYMAQKDRQVRANMRSLVQKTRALMRLGAFRSQARSSDTQHDAA